MPPCRLPVAALLTFAPAPGVPQAGLHVRRSDKLTACNPEDCKQRDELTRPAAILRDLQLWLPAQSHVYIGSTEPPAFFDPLRAQYRLHFAEDFAAELSNVTNNYALYALETLLFFGADSAVETYSYQAQWFVDACFPAAAVRAGRAPRARAPGSRGSEAVRVQCRDAGSTLINGVLYGRACSDNPPCGKKMSLVPKPASCDKGPLRTASEMASSPLQQAKGFFRRRASQPAGACNAQQARMVADGWHEALSSAAPLVERSKRSAKAGGGKAGGGKAGGGKAVGAGGARKKQNLLKAQLEGLRSEVAAAAQEVRPGRLSSPAHALPPPSYRHDAQPAPSCLLARLLARALTARSLPGPARSSSTSAQSCSRQRLTTPQP